MLSNPAREVIENCDPSKEISIILSWNARPDFANVSGNEKREIARLFYRETKQPVISRLLRTSGVRVVDPLEGMHTAILSAPANIWQQMLRSEDSLLYSGDLQVIPESGREFTIPAVVHG